MSIKLLKDTSQDEPDQIENDKIEEELQFIQDNPDLSNQEIADQLGISRWAVERRRRKLQAKTAKTSKQRDELLSELAELLDQRDATKDRVAELDSEIDRIAAALLEGE